MVPSYLPISLAVNRLPPFYIKATCLGNQGREERAETEQSQRTSAPPLLNACTASKTESVFATKLLQTASPQLLHYHPFFLTGTNYCTLCFRDLSVVANTTVAEASQALVIQALVPFRTHSSPSRRATVEAAPASLPFPEQSSSKQTSGDR